MKLITILLFLASLLSACDMRGLNPIYEASKVAENYPSGSTICQLNDKFYVMGDDSAEILVLNQDMEETGRIEIFKKGDEMRLPKDTKADVESSVAVNYQGKSAVLFLGSGSFSPHRDSIFLMDPELKQVTRIDSQKFYDSLRLEVNELNIEAAAMIDEELLLGLRANTSHPENYIAIAEIKELTFTFKRKILIQSSFENAGISGMDYHQDDDILFITFSSEDTSNAYDDGQIGESYLALVTDARSALKQQKLMLNRVVKLSDLSPEFRDQKIESVSLMNGHRKLMLVADDDKGQTKIFTIKY